MPIPPWHPESFAARLPFLRRRALLTQATRAFFAARGYTEVETAYAVPAPGEEVHLRRLAHPAACAGRQRRGTFGCTPARNSR